MLSFFFILQCGLTISAMKTSHPFILSLHLVGAAGLAGVTLGMAATFWLGLALALIFLGGMMVIFLYFASLGASEKASKTTPRPVTLMGGAVLAGALEAAHFSSPLQPLALAFEPLNIVVGATLILYLLYTLIVVVELAQGFQGTLETTWF